jgi:hypothetical protein
MGLPNFPQMVTADADALEYLLKEAPAPSTFFLHERGFNGVNTHWFTKIMGIKKFRKYFYSKGESMEGFNIEIKQDPFFERTQLDGLWKPTKKLPFGKFNVLPNPHEHYSALEAYPNALLLDYGNNENSLFEGDNLRDVIVQVGELLLGKAYMKVGSLFVPSSYFVCKPCD